MSRSVARLTLIALSALAAACDKVPLLAPTDSTVTLSTNTTTLAINGTAEVLATVIEAAGTPVHNGTTVTFTASVGTIEPREARTENGVARATFRAGTTSGTARIGAFSGAARADEVEILVGGAAAATVAVRVEPSSVPQTGGRVDVIAIVSDVSGNRLPGAPVVFSTDNGTLGSSSGVTDQNGESKTTLTTNRQTIVRANVAGKEGQATIAVVNLPTVSIAVAPTQPLVDQTTTFTVTPGSTTNGNPIQNVVLDFGDGTPAANLGAISGATPVQHTYRRADNYTVTATVIDTSGQRVPITTIVSVQRGVVSVSVVPSATTGQIGTPISFNVSVSNPNNIPIQSVLLDYGDGSSVTLGSTGGNPSKTYLRSGSFTVTATAIDQNGNRYPGGSASITIAEAPAFNVTLDAAQGDPAIPISCNPTGATYPKTCTATLSGAGVRVIFSAGCSTGLGSGGCANAIRYIWNFGDGSPSETTTSNSVDHVFRSRSDGFNVTVTVQTSTGTGTQRLTMIIQ